MMNTNALKAIDNAKRRSTSTNSQNFQSLSNTIRYIKRNWSSGFDKLFSKYGFSNRTAVSPASVKSMLSPNMFKRDSTGQLQIAIWVKSVQKRVDGKPVLNDNGEVVKVPVQRIVKSWTPTKLLQVLAQSAAFRSLLEDNL